MKAKRWKCAEPTCENKIDFGRYCEACLVEWMKTRKRLKDILERNYRMTNEEKEQLGKSTQPHHNELED